jgi:hypothetical protein
MVQVKLANHSYTFINIHMFIKHSLNFETTFIAADGMSSVATGGTGANGKQGGVPFLDNSSDDDTGNPQSI